MPLRVSLSIGPAASKMLAEIVRSEQKKKPSADGRSWASSILRDVAKSQLNAWNDLLTQGKIILGRRQDGSFIQLSRADIPDLPLEPSETGDIELTIGDKLSEKLSHAAGLNLARSRIMGEPVEWSDANGWMRTVLLGTISARYSQIEKEQIDDEEETVEAEAALDQERLKRRTETLADKLATGGARA
jgi:hypothetical protein